MLPLHFLVPTSLICLQTPSDLEKHSPTAQSCWYLVVRTTTSLTNTQVHNGKTLNPERKRVSFVHLLTNSVKHEAICIKISKFSSYIKENITRIIFGDHVVNVSGKKSVYSEHHMRRLHTL